MATLQFDLGSFSIQSDWKEDCFTNDMLEYTSITTAPTTGYSTRTISSSMIPSGAVIKSATLNATAVASYSSSLRSYSANKYISNSGSIEANNSNIAVWLTNMGEDFTDMGIVFQIRAASNQALNNQFGTFNRWIKLTYNNVSLEIEYEYSDRGSDGKVTFADNFTLEYHFSPIGLLEGEITNGTYLLTGSATGLKVDYRPYGFSNHTEGEVMNYTSSGTTSILTNVMGYSSYASFPERATPMQVRFTLYKNNTTETSDWLDAGVFFLKERALPVVEAAVVDTAGYFERYGRPIQNKSTLNYTFTITTDPYSEAIVTDIVGILDGNQVEITNNFFSRPITKDENELSTFTIRVTDSFGIVSETNYDMYSYTYFAPKIDAFKVSRYALKDGEPFFAGEGNQGALTLKAETASLGGQNTYSIVFSDGITSTTLYEGIGNPAINIKNDIQKLSSYTFNEDEVYNCYINLIDDLNTVTRFSTVRRSGAPVLDIEQIGVGFGVMPTSPFDCAFPANFTQPVHFSAPNGINSIMINGTEYAIQQASIASAREGFITIVTEEAT